ncbi:MAG: hypothetical protein AAFY75_04085 [Pseudomonadota bacterium]
MHSVADIERAMATLAELMNASPRGAALAPVFERLEAERARAAHADDAVDRAAAFLARRAG